MQHVYNYFDHIRAINVAPTKKERIKFTLEQLEKCPKVDLKSFIDKEGEKFELNFLSVGFYETECIGMDVVCDSPVNTSNKREKEVNGYTVYTGVSYSSYYNHWHSFVSLATVNPDDTFLLKINTTIDKMPMTFKIQFFDNRIIEIEMNPGFETLYRAWYIHGTKLQPASRLSELLKNIVQENIPELKQAIQTALLEAEKEADHLKKLL